MKSETFAMMMNAIVEARVNGWEFTRYDSITANAEHKRHLAGERKRIADTAAWLKANGGVSANMVLRIHGPITVYPDGNYDLR
jgi:hypothetical protein